MSDLKQENAALRLGIRNLRRDFEAFKGEAELALHKIHNDRELLDMRMKLAILRREKGIESKHN